MSGCQVWIVKEREAAGHKVWEWQADCGETGTGKTAARAHLDECGWAQPDADPHADLRADLDAQLEAYRRQVQEETAEAIADALMDASLAKQREGGPMAGIALEAASRLILDDWEDWV